MPHAAVLITGVNGFLGQCIAAAFESAGWRVAGIDISEQPSRALAAYRQTTLPDGGLASFIGAVAPDLVVHCAGRASVGASVKEPGPDYWAGPPALFSVLEAIRTQAPQCKLVLLSSAAVYGSPARMPVSEEAAPAPISPYGFHKWQCELLCREFSSIYGVRTAAVRVFSAYGEGLRRQVLWDVCTQLLRDGRLDLRGTGEETRDFVHGQDVARGVLLVARAAEMNGEVYNLATGRATRIRDLAALAARGLGVNVTPSFDGVVPAGDPPNWQADMRKMSGLGFRAALRLEEGVARYARWCKERFVAAGGS